MHDVNQRVKPAPDSGQIVLLRNFHALMSQKDRRLFKGHAGKRHFDCKSVAEYMRIATLRAAIRFPEVGMGE